MQEEKKYIGRGGWRGGGRPKKDNSKTKTMSIVGSEEEIEQIKAIANMSNKTISRFIIDTILMNK